MKINRFSRAVVILIFLAFNIGCDQLSKTIVRHNLGGFNQYSYVYNHFTIRRVENTGAFLSLGDTLPATLKILLLNILPLLIVVAGLAFILIKTGLDRVILFGLILVIGGGAGNLYDRIVHGSVTDFMHINFVIFQTGVFNVADLSITTGVVIMLLRGYLPRKPKEEVKGVS
jgi:signal peptidase II